MSKRRRLNLAIMLSMCLATSAVFTGCASSKIALTAKHAGFPVSITEGFYDRNWKLLLREDYTVVRAFKLTYSHSTFSWLSPPLRIDLSEVLREILTTNNGDAIVDLRVTGGGSTSLNTLYGPIVFVAGHLTLGLIGPAHVITVVEGHVVKVNR